MLVIIQQCAHDPEVLLLRAKILQFSEAVACVEPHTNSPNWIAVLPSSILPLQFTGFIDVKKSSDCGKLRKVQMRLELHIAMLGNDLIV